jgi:hypothetical protein
MTISAAALLPRHVLSGGIVLVCCTGIMLLLFSPADPAWLVVGLPGAAGILAISDGLFRLSSRN